MRFINLVFILILFGCKKQSYQTVNVFGHAGMGLDMQNSIYHDNTLEAIELALSYNGSNGVEVDVQMDSQGCLWLFHNELMDGVLSLKGCINEKATIELENVTYNTLKKEKLQKLQNILKSIPSSQKLFLDIKSFNACSGLSVDRTSFISSIQKLNIGHLENVYLIVSDENWLNEFDSSFNLLFSTDDLTYAKDLFDKYSNLDGIVIRNKMIQTSEVEVISNLGKSVFLYDLRSPKGNRQALEKKPTGIITDDIRAALIERD